MHACMHACMHAYIHAYTHAHTRTRTHINTHAHIDIYAHTYVHTKIQKPIYLSIYLSIYIHIYIYICVYIYIYIIHISDYYATHVKKKKNAVWGAGRVVSLRLEGCSQLQEPSSQSAVGGEALNVRSILFGRSGGLLKLRALM